VGGLLTADNVVDACLGDQMEKLLWLILHNGIGVLHGGAPLMVFFIFILQHGVHLALDRKNRKFAQNYDFLFFGGKNAPSVL
jgi:hypothetical protein